MAWTRKKFAAFVASGGWSPYAFGSDLVAWYRPNPNELWSDNVGTLAVPGGSVRMWRDASGNSNHLDQSSGVSQPSLTATGQVENLVRYSGDLTQWTGIGAPTVTPNRVTATATSSAFVRMDGLSVSLTDVYCFSVRIEESNSPFVWVQVGNIPFARQYFNVGSGALGASLSGGGGTVVSASIETVSPGVYDLILVVTAVSDTRCHIGISQVDTGSLSPVVGTFVTVSNVQLQEGSGTKSYIATGANPIWAGIGGYAGIKTDGTDDWIGATFAAPLVDNYTLAVVMRVDEHRSAQAEYYIGSGATGASRALVYHNPGGGRLALIGSSSAHILPGSFSSGQLDYYILELGGGLERVTTSSSTGTLAATAGDQLPGIRLGAETTVNHGKASYVAALVLNRAMTDSERTLLQNLWANRYAIP